MRSTILQICLIFRCYQLIKFCQRLEQRRPFYIFTNVNSLMLGTSLLEFSVRKRKLGPESSTFLSDHTDSRAKDLSDAAATPNPLCYNIT